MRLPSFAQFICLSFQKHNHKSFSAVLPPLRIPKFKRRMCSHERNRYICRECGGSSLCVHQKRRYLCIECRGPKQGYLRALRKSLG